MISKRRLEATRKRMPLRVQMRVYSLLSGDTFASPKKVPAERRPESIQEQRSPDAAADATQSEYVFYQADLESTVLKEDDMLYDIERQKYYSVDSVSMELAGTRVRAMCSPGTNPNLDLS